MSRTERRHKRLQIAQSISLGPVDLMTLMKEIPKDAVLVNVSTDWVDYANSLSTDPDIMILTFWHESWDIIPNWMTAPDLNIHCTRDGRDESERFYDGQVESKPQQPLQTGSGVFTLPPGFQIDPSLREVFNCRCDMGYTGLTTHYPQCPVSPKKKS